MAATMKPYLLDQAWFETLDAKAQKKMFKFPMELYTAYIAQVAKPALEWVNLIWMKWNESLIY